MSDFVGTHMGHLTEEGRQRRKVKNARNQSKRGQATRPSGSQRRPAKLKSKRAR